MAGDSLRPMLPYYLGLVASRTTKLMETDVAHTIKSLKLPQKVKADYDTPEPAVLSRLSSLNVFIGTNNSGKSRLLREVFADKSMEFEPTWESYRKLRELAPTMTKTAADLLRNANCNVVILNGNSYPECLKAVVPPNMITEGIVPVASIRKFMNEFKTHTNTQINGGYYPQNIFPGIDRELQDKFWPYVKEHLSALPNELKFRKVYIPSLRGLRAPDAEPQFFRNRTVNDYFKDVDLGIKSGDYQIGDQPIITGLELYTEVRNHLLGEMSQRQLITEYQEYLGATFFDGSPVALIPRHGSDVLHVKIGDEAEQPIFKLGDGIQQIIILTLPLFIHRNADLLYFIEEPELYLHPGMQRSLIDAILDTSNCKSRQTFVATHSAQFLDITLDSSQVSVYKFRKELPSSPEKAKHPRFSIASSSNKDFQLLAELGIRNSSVLLSNCTIWVEGITDRLYFKRYFDLYQVSQPKKFREDFHFSFVEYGGGNITHWAFLDKEGIDPSRVCGTLLLIADQDAGQAKAERRELLQTCLGERYLCLPCREVENLLTPAVIEKVIKSYEGDAVELNPFKQEDYTKQYLGDFIETTILKSAQTSKRRSAAGKPYSAESGTIKDKVTFAHKALANLRSSRDISSEAVAVAKRIYKFVESHNH